MDSDERNRKDTKRSEVCFWDLNPDETHLTILQETMRLIVLMVNLVMIKGILHFFLEIGSFYNSPRVEQLGFTVFESIQPIF